MAAVANFIEVLSTSTGLGAIEKRAEGCIGKAMCQGPIKKPLECAGKAPWVVCSFVSCDPLKGGQIAATVGGFDPAAKSEGLIKSFSMGFSDGVGCKIEIMDRKGSDLNRFFQKLNKDITEVKKDFIMQVKWGWSCTPCAAANEKMPKSDCHYFLPESLQVNYSNGGFKYILEGKDTAQKLFQTINDNVYPEGGGKMKLKDAVIQAWKESTPPTEVSFRRRVPGTKTMSIIDEPFVTTHGQPVTGNWPCGGTNTMSAVVKWKADYKTDKGYGLKPMFNNESSTPHIMYVESGCKAGVTDLCERTYIVNGGKHSPVISFNPTIVWNPQVTAEAYGGGAGSTDTGASMKRKASEEDNDCIVVEAAKNVGERTAIPPTEQVVENEGPDNAQKATDEGMNVQANANNNFSEPINAELIVEGDPGMDRALSWHGKYISIVVVNPFHPVVKRQGSKGQIKNSEWLANPTCNPILTSKTYRITKINHDMKEGSYTTAISVSRDPSGT